MRGLDLEAQVPATHPPGTRQAPGPVQGPLVLGLDDPTARDPALTGSKAASLAVLLATGRRALPGVVLTTAFTATVDMAEPLERNPALREAYLRVGGRDRSLVARSSSLDEDTANASMAGQFDSVIGVTGLSELASAVRTVLESRTRAGSDAPMAVLIQPLLKPALGGVLFGVDPVSGRSDRRIVSAVRGGPEPLVSGRVTGSHYEIDAAGRVTSADVGTGPRLTRRQLRSLGALSSDVAQVFGSPQDIEWAIDASGELWLLQARPVTTAITGVPLAPLYGPGPVSETFPAPLTRLEQDLWVPPLRDAVREAVTLAGDASPRAIRDSEVVVVVDGRVAIDLALVGEVSHQHGGWRRLNPLPAARALRSAWRVGRLKAALPALAEAALHRADADLAAVPSLTSLSSSELGTLLRRSQVALRALHAHEMLVGLLLDPSRTGVTGASLALAVLDERRREGLDDTAIVEADPIVLALSPPRIAPRADLPQETTAGSRNGHRDRGAGDDHAILREALRLRVRWVQELSGRAAWELGVRLTRRGALTDPEQVRHITLEQAVGAATGAPLGVETIVAGDPVTGPPLPAQFHLSDAGHPIAVRVPRDKTAGTGAGGGWGHGPVTHDSLNPPPGAVLVTTTLTPGLGPLLPRLAGIVAETGSVLSHLAILAREAGVPTVVGFPGAVEALPEGAIVTLHGDTGEVVRHDTEHHTEPNTREGR